MKGTVRTVMIALLCLIVAPIAIPLGIAALAVGFAVCLAVISGLLAVIIMFLALALALFAGGIACAVGGFVYLCEVPLAGIIILGGGLILVAIALCCAVMTELVCVEAIPAVFRFMKHLVTLPFKARGGTYETVSQ